MVNVSSINQDLNRLIFFVAYFICPFLTNRLIAKFAIFV